MRDTDLKWNLQQIKGVRVRGQVSRPPRLPCFDTGERDAGSPKLAAGRRLARAGFSLYPYTARRDSLKKMKTASTFGRCRFCDCMPLFIVFLCSLLTNCREVPSIARYAVSNAQDRVRADPPGRYAFPPVCSFYALRPRA